MKTSFHALGTSRPQHQNPFLCYYPASRLRGCACVSPPTAAGGRSNATAAVPSLTSRRAALGLLAGVTAGLLAAARHYRGAGEALEAGQLSFRPAVRSAPPPPPPRTPASCAPCPTSRRPPVCSPRHTGTRRLAGPAAPHHLGGDALARLAGGPPAGGGGGEEPRG